MEPYRSNLNDILSRHMRENTREKKLK